MTELGYALTVIGEKAIIYDIVYQHIPVGSSNMYGFTKGVYHFKQTKPMDDSRQYDFDLFITGKFTEKSESVDKIDALIVKHALDLKREKPKEKAFTLSLDTIEELGKDSQLAGKILERKILEFYYHINIVFPSQGIAKFDVMDNFNAEESEIEIWMKNLREKRYLIENSQSRYPRRRVSTTPYRMNPEKVKAIEEELSIRSTGGQNIIDPSKHEYFHLIETHTESQGPFVFVIMPLKDSEFPQDVFEIYKEIVEKELHINCVCANSEMRKNYIESKIYSLIVKAKLIIVELSTENSNVVFEFGMALALNKSIILTNYGEYANKEKKLAFDYNHFDTISYDNYEELKTELRTALIPYK